MAAKAKFKIDQAVIQQFFIDHTEKIVMTVFGLCFCYLAYDAFTRPRYEKTVASLQTLVNNAKDRTIKGPSDPDCKVSTKYPIPAFADDLDKQRGLKIPPEIKPMIISPVEKRNPRDMPKGLPVINLVATPGRGAFSANSGGNAANGKQIGKHWVVIAGLVPFKEQQDIYRANFEKCSLVDPKRDSPIYDGYFVERVEVNGLSNREPDWSKSKFYYSPAVSSDLATLFPGGAQPELVDDELTDEALTFTLPPLADAKWDKEIAHDPEIPISKQKLAAADAAAMQMGAGGAAPLPVGRSGGRNPRGRGDFMPGSAPGGGRGAGSRRPGGGSRDAFAVRTLPPAGPEAPVAAQEAATPKYKLLRFFDFEVEPGKTYRYRIFLVLVNPNVGLDAKDLKNPADGDRDNSYIGHDKDKEKLDDQKFITWANPKVDYMPWSDPTSLVAIPSDQGILAGDVVTPPRATEPQGEITTYVFAENGGKPYTVVEKVKRGQMLELQPRPSENDPKGEKYDFSTKDVIVDMRGGEALSPREKEFIGPGQILTLASDGSLVIHSGSDEADTIAKLHEKPIVVAPSRARGGNSGRFLEGGRPEKPRGKEPDLVNP